MIGAGFVTNKYKTGEVVKKIGLQKGQRKKIHDIVERMGINVKKDRNGDYLYNDELVDLIKMYVNLKREVNISYKELKLLEDIINKASSKVEGVQKTYEILKYYDCTANYIDTLKLFYISCNSVLGYSDESRELVEEVTGDINVYPHENESLQSMYDYFLYQAHVLDLVIELSKLELEPDIEFWQPDVVKIFLTYIDTINAEYIKGSDSINDTYISFLIPDTDLKALRNTLIEKIELLLRELKQYFNKNGLGYDRSKEIFTHAVMLLGITVFPTGL